VKRLAQNLAAEFLPAGPSGGEVEMPRLIDLVRGRRDRVGGHGAEGEPIGFDPSAAS
jgi:hypothetical protein